MSLENSKGYGLRERIEAQQEQAKNKSNGASPHQAPQRERVSQALMPLSWQPPHRRVKKWTDMHDPDRNMGLPQLLMILEPNIVWEHSCGWAEVWSRNMGRANSWKAGTEQGGWHGEFTRAPTWTCSATARR